MDFDGLFPGGSFFFDDGFGIFFDRLFDGVNRGETVVLGGFFGFFFGFCRFFLFFGRFFLGFCGFFGIFVKFEGAGDIKAKNFVKISFHKISPLGLLRYKTIIAQNG